MPEETMDEKVLQELHSCVGQFRHIMEDSGFVKLRRLKDNELLSHNAKSGIIEQYCYLSPGEEPLIKDMLLEENIRIGSQHCQLYTLAGTEDLIITLGNQPLFSFSS